jgi:predicted dehydrogenase
VALTPAELESLNGVCRQHPAVHLAGMMFSRYTPGFYTAWKLIRDGAVGEVRHVDARKSYKLGARPAYYAARETYGGTIPWVGSHAIDWVLWFYGQTARLTSVHATHSTVGNGGNGTMEATAACLFQLEAGRTASVSIDYLRPADAPSHGDDWARVVGTRGVMEVRPESVVIAGEPAPWEVSCPLTPVADFLDHVDGTRRSILDASQTLALTEACLLARRAADEGRTIGFPQGVV